MQQDSEHIQALREIVPRLHAHSACGPKMEWALPEGLSEAWCAFRDGGAVSVTKGRVRGIFPVHVHKEREVLVVYGGSLRYTSNRVTRVLESGDSIEIPANEAHQIESVGGGPCLVIAVHVPAGEGLPG